MTASDSLQSVTENPLADGTAAILVGGLGTRLRSVVSDRPKPLANVDGRPFLAWQLEWLAAVGVRRVVLCCGFQGELVQRSLGDRFGPLELVYSQEPKPLGTAGALRLAASLVLDATLLALNGDSFCPANLAAFARMHVHSHLPASLLLARVEDVSRYGAVSFDPTGRLTQFEEKGATTGAGWINAGAYLFEMALLQEIPTGRSVSLEREMFPAWLPRGLYGHCTEAPFLDIGTPESYAQASEFLASARHWDESP